MSKFYTVNFKEIVYSAEDTTIYLDMEIEKAKAMKAEAFKVLHGYGSHGQGGKICLELRNYAYRLKRQGKIKEVFTGGEWAIQNQNCFNFIKTCADATLDEDLGKQNPGITIIVL